MAGPADTAAPAAAEPTLLDVLEADATNVLDAQLPTDIRPLFVALVDRLGSTVPKLLEGKTAATEAAEAEATPGSPAAVPPAPGGEPVPIENTPAAPTPAPPVLAEPEPTPAGEPIPIAGDDELAEAAELEQLRTRNAELEQQLANANANANPPAVTSSPGEPAPSEGAPA